METVKIGIREFRENLAGYLESDKPLALTRHGETLGFYIPAQKRSPKAELQAMRAAAKDLEEMIASWRATEDELMDEFKPIPPVVSEVRTLHSCPECSLLRNCCSCLSVTVVCPAAQSPRPAPADPEARAPIWACAFRRWSAHPLLESRVCQYENSVDHNFILDRHPEAENLRIVGGGSGHGFKHGPAMGEIVADAVSERSAPPSEMALGRLQKSNARSTSDG